MIQLLFTKEQTWLDKWDLFLLNNPKGTHLVLSDWIKSYTSYGFDYEIGILLNEKNQIVGGFGAVIPKMWFFRFYIVPHGPIFIEDYVDQMDDCLFHLKKRAKKLKCCYTQISVPISSHMAIAKQSYLPSQINADKIGFKTGKLFDYVYCSYGLNWVSLEGYKDANDLLKDLKSHARRNIKIAYKNELVIEEAITEKAIKKAYELVEINALNSGYSVRSYNEIKHSLISLIEKNMGLFLIASHNGLVKGSAFFVKNNDFLTYLFGGTLKERPDQRVGYFLHWEAIKRSFESNAIGYNISMGGSHGVLRFKSQFKAEQLFYESPHLHVILNQPIFHMFVFIKKYLKPYKKSVSNILSKFNRKSTEKIA